MEKRKMNLNQFIGKNQLSIISRLARQGEEREYFRNMILDLKNTIATMPNTYETEFQGDNAIATLHYFNGASDWYIIEKDQGEEQIQAFGFACLNGDKQNAELGYISIQELIENGVELDLYYKPEKIVDIKQNESLYLCPTLSARHDLHPEGKI
jgi:hypothetical protein